MKIKLKKLQNRSYFNLLNSSLCMYISNNRLSKAWRKHCWHVGEQRTWRNWKHRTWTIVLVDYNVSISVCKTCMLFHIFGPLSSKSASIIQIKLSSLQAICYYNCITTRWKWLAVIQMGHLQSSPHFYFGGKIYSSCCAVT